MTLLFSAIKCGRHTGLVASEAGMQTASKVALNHRKSMTNLVMFDRVKGL